MVRAGGASGVINPPIGAVIQGASVDQRAEFIRDDLEANVLFLDDGTTAILLVSCDLAGLTTPFCDRARAAMAAAAGVPVDHVAIACTHTHSGPSVLRTNYLKPLDDEYLEQLQGWLPPLAAEAAANARPARLAWGAGQARIGYNRRCCWADGTHSMHGDSTREDFAGLEGPDDPQHLALFAQDLDGKLIGLLHHNTTHTTCFYGRNFFSSDYPGVSRGYLREAVGDSLPVVFFNGAFGDISIGNMLASHPNGRGGEMTMLRAAHLVAGETLRLLHDSPFRDEADLKVSTEQLTIGVRLPPADHVAWSREILRKTDAGEPTGAWDRLRAFGAVALQDEFGDNPVDQLMVQAIRIGDLGLAFQPTELYCQYGLDVKRRSPAPLTGLVSVANGYHGYCPTAHGVLGGGYSGEPIHWTRLAADGGYRIADSAARQLCALW